MSWESNVRRVEPYVPGEQPKENDIIKLNTNENPYPPSPNAVKALEHFDTNKMRLYPDPDSQILVEALADYCCENGGIIFPNPNAPTGVLEGLSMIEKIIKSNPDSIVIIDEAYIDFGGESRLPLIEKYDNLLVVQTFSKSRSMAGMRIGFAMGNEKLIKYMNDVKFSVNSYTMNPVTQICGAESVKDEVYFKKTVDKIIATRENAKIKLKNLGFNFPDSKSNFIFASHNTKPANEIFDELKKRKIFVRYWNKPRISNYLRITVGTPEEMTSLLNALEEITAQ